MARKPAVKKTPEPTPEAVTEQDPRGTLTKSGPHSFYVRS